MTIKKLSEIQIDSIIQDYQNDMSHQEIAEKHGIHNNSVSRIIKREGSGTDRRKILSKEIETLVIQQYRAGKFISIIASELQVHDSTISRILKRNGIEKISHNEANRIIEAAKQSEMNKSYAIEMNPKYLDESKYGTTFIPSWNGIQLNKENISQFNESQKTQVAQFVFEWFRSGGFPYPTKTSHELLHEFALLYNTAPNSILGEANENGNLVLKTANQNGTAIFKHFSPHFFEVKEGKNLKRPSMLETFQDDDRLMKVIINRMDQNFQVNGNMLRQGLSNSKIAFKASIFNPMIARYLYSKYTTEGDIVYDYSMGFGQRLTAALSLDHKIKYVGVDVLGKSVSGNQAIFSFFQDNIPSFNKEAEIVQAGSEEYCPEQYQGKVKLAFSSPPYFNLEHYSNDKSQAYSDCSYANFINGYWKKTVVNIDKLLLPEGYFLLNIKETIGAFNLAEDMLNVIKGQGFKLLGRYDMQLSRNTAFGGRDDKHKYEPIFVLKRA